jgi:hypothetical protein
MFLPDKLMTELLPYSKDKLVFHLHECSYLTDEDKRGYFDKLCRLTVSGTSIVDSNGNFTDWYDVPAKVYVAKNGSVCYQRYENGQPLRGPYVTKYIVDPVFSESMSEGKSGSIGGSIGGSMNMVDPDEDGEDGDVDVGEDVDIDVGEDGDLMSIGDDPDIVIDNRINGVATDDLTMTDDDYSGLTSKVSKLTI